MLAAVLIMTVVPSWVRIGRAVIEHACYLISQKLLENTEVSKLSEGLVTAVMNPYQVIPYDGTLFENINSCLFKRKLHFTPMYPTSYPWSRRIYG